MGLTFQKATRKQSRLRLALVGPSGSGKTYTALAVTCAMARTVGRVAVIDTERGSASKYAGLFEFDVLELDRYEPARYVEAIQSAERAGYTHLVVDSLTHAWAGKGGALEMVDNAAARNRDNKFAAWRDVTPQHHLLIDAIVGSACHVIATMRSKTEWVLEENERGKKVPRRIGTAPVQRDGMEYEFDVVGELDLDHKLVVTKSRCMALADAVIHKPGAQVADALAAWLTDGAPAAVPVDHSPEAYGTAASPTQAADLALAGPHLPPVAEGAAKLAFDLINDRLNKVPGYGGDENKPARKAWWAQVLGFVDVGPKWSPYTPYTQGDAETKRHVVAQLEQLELRVAAAPPAPYEPPPHVEDDIPF